MKPVRSAKEYVLVYLALMTLLGLTFGSAYLDLGMLNPALNLSISCLKAILVGIFFMHLKGSRGLTRLFAGAGLFWLGILLTLVLTDYFSRGWLPLPGHWPPNS